MLLGSHLSIQGGVDNALTAADEHGFQAVAMFVRNQVRWECGRLTEDTCARFIARREELGIGPVVAHASYLVNLAAEGELRAKSIAAMVEDLTRCNRLGVDFLVLHPGVHADAEAGIRRIAEALDEVTAAVETPGGAKLLLETTAGQGNSIGHRFEHLADILHRLRKRTRFGVCLDTCHIFAAGYDIRTPEAYAETMDAFQRTIGRKFLKAIHLNDSKKDLGSRVDRHDHIGDGKIGLAGFANFVNDEALAEVPMILETPKGKAPDGRDWDEINAERLRSLAGKRPAASADTAAGGLAGKP